MTSVPRDTIASSAFEGQSLDLALTIPDLWQQEAVRHLQGGWDVIVDAPTGAGKTFIFELFMKSGAVRGQAVFTVPTRALANDKLMEWRAKKWNVGISTGDIAENLDAPVLIATLETQKARLQRGHTPAIIVIDEYQMIADASRGINYETAIILAAPSTQLLLLSGSVGNPETLLQWLERIGRKVRLVRHRERPVPQEQVFLEGLTNRIPKTIFGYWPENIARALNAGLGPILLFAPHRKDSERIARQLAASFPQDDPLELSPEQSMLAGDSLSKLLRNRIAFHHSGLSYRQRAGLIEPLAKAGQLRVVVATTGLGAGINFSMRSVIVADREYRQDEQVSMVRSDELLQMFGRAGRRGLDERGYVLTLPGKPRLEDAAPIHLRRTPQIDWPSFIGVMHRIQSDNRRPQEAAELLARSLFSDTPVSLGFDSLSQGETARPSAETERSRPSILPDDANTVIEILNSDGVWERRKGPVPASLEHTLYHHRGSWKHSNQVADALRFSDTGSTCLLFRSSSGHKIYGKEWAIAQFPRQTEHNKLQLAKNYRARLRATLGKGEQRKIQVPKFLSLEDIEQHLNHTIPLITSGGSLHALVERGGTLYARIDLSAARILARKDRRNRLLFNPPERQVIDGFTRTSIRELQRPATPTESRRSIAHIWESLGLIDKDAQPTRRGVLFSFFNHGEGLAVAAALEDVDYPIEALIWDLTNLRAGHRFDSIGDLGSRLSYVSREAYGNATYPGYLKIGVPEEYGEGASDLIYQTFSDSKSFAGFLSEDVKTGDIERIQLEWRSILRQIAHAPEFPWDRWSALQLKAREWISQHDRAHPLSGLPSLTPRQKSRKPLPVNWR